MVRLGVLTMSLMILAACGQRSHWTEKVPNSNLETGFLVKTEKAELESFLDKNGLEARVINEEQGLFEVFAKDPSLIQDQLKPRFMEKNQYMENLVPVANSRPLMPSNVFSQLINNQTSDDSEGLERCIPMRKKPDLQLVIKRDGQAVVGMPTIELGSEFSFDASGSKNHADVSGDLKIAFAVMAPQFSDQSSSGPTMQDQLTLKPDALGMYQVMVLVQDENRSCDYSGFAFMVTSNPEFPGNQEIKDLDESILKNFRHLDPINAREAWKHSMGEGQVIAIADTGVDYAHPALSGNFLTNDGEIPNNGIDDDGNGYIDDYVGYDFSNNDGHPFDDGGHGSHVAGLSSSPYFGTAPRSKILPVKLLNAAGGGDIGTIIKGFYYAVDRGADIINASLGSHSTEFLLLKEAIDYAEKNDVLVVVSSGNGDPRTGRSLDIDTYPQWPASFKNDNIITVGATSIDRSLTFYANTGVEAVDIVAPGGDEIEGLISAASWNPKGVALVPQVGTSMATPVVAGAAAVVRALHPQLSASEIKDLLMNRSYEVVSYKDLIRSSGFLDMQLATRRNSPTVLAEAPLQTTTSKPGPLKAAFDLIN